MVRIGLPVTYNAEILLGRISKVYGHDGTVNVRLEKKFIEKIPLMKSVFLEVEGEPVPFLIADSDYPGGDILRLQFKGYESSDLMTEFTGCRVFLTENTTSETEEIPDYNLLSGYFVFSSGRNKIGIIKEIIENPGQLLAEVLNSSGRTVLIPLHDDIIINIDPAKKEIEMDLPDGLEDLNQISE